MQKRCADLGVALEGAELIEVYRGLMAIADDRKTITDNDIRAVIEHADREKIVTDADLVAIVSRVRGGEADRPVVLVSPVADFSTTPAESGYGHGV